MAGVQIDGVNNIIKADTISEVTSANGVAVDGVTLKDGGGTFTSPVLVPDGSTSAVSLGNDGDPNTGIYFQAADSLGLVLGGSRKLSATSTGIAIENGTLSAKGGAVFNEDSADVDFRVESNANTHMLFVDGGNNSIGINNSTPGSYDGGADDLVVGDHSVSSQGITIASDDNSILYFADGTSGDERYRGSIIYNHPADNFIIRTAGFNTRMTIDSTGTVTIPNQPAFLVPGTTQDNIASGISTVSFGGTERFDQNADFNTSNYTFTAPVTGKYYFSVKVQLGNLDNTHDYCRTHLVTSNNTYYLEIISPDKIFSADVPYVSFQNSMLVDMDASDTAYVQINLNGGNGGQADLTVTQSYFSGFLAC